MFRYVSRKKGLLLLVVIVLASFLWMTSQARQPKDAGLAQRAVSAVSYPFVLGAHKLAETAKGVFYGYFYLVGIEKENRRLKAEAGKLSFENTRLREALAVQARAGGMQALKGLTDIRMVPARVVGRDSSSWFRSVWIDEGESSGIRRNMPAAAYTGVVGKVIRPLGGTARVLLITDRGSAVSAVTERTREPGIVVGEGGELCRFQYVAKHADIAKGDLLVTSGLDGIFPAGMPVGEVVRVTRGAPGYFQEIEVRPTADITRLEELMVLKYEPEPVPAPEPERRPYEKGSGRP